MCDKYPQKVAYETEGKAIKALKKMPRRMSTGNRPYRCGDHWHVGRPTKHTVQAIKRQSRKEQRTYASD